MGGTFREADRVGRGVTRPAPLAAGATVERVPLLAILLCFLQVGGTSFGMAMLHKMKALVVRNEWMSEAELDEGLACWRWV